MMEVKGEVGHLIYEVGRKIDQAIDSEADSAKTTQLRTSQKALAQYSQGLYQGADYNDMKELRKRARNACQDAKAKLKDYVSAELPELEAVLGKLQQGEDYYSTRAQNSFSVASRNSYGRLSYEGFSGKDQSSYLVPSSDFSSRYQLPQRTFPQTLSVSRSFVNRKKSILETASRNSSRVSNEVNIDNSPVSQGEEKSKNNFAKSASSAEEVDGILPLRTWEGWLQFEHGGFDSAAPDITFSALTASQRREAVQKELALIAVKDEQIAALASDWERILQDLNKVSRAGESVRLGDGARLYAELLSLISATRAILPPHLAQMGRLNLLMHWAAAYAEMVQHGDLPMRGGAMKGAVAEKFLSAMRKQRDALLLQGLSEEEAREAMAQLGAERLDRSLRKVTVACRDQLNRYVKEQAWERIESIRKRAMPKSEPGHRSKKGKMDSDHYRTMGEIMRALRMTEEQMDEEYQAVVAQMQELTGTEEDYEKRHEKLHDSLNILTTYGCWQAMSSAQALKAAESFAEFVATGRNSWKSELDKRKRKSRWMMRRMTENMRKQATPAAVNKEQNKDATGVRRTVKRAALAYIYGLMNFSHLMQAKTRQLVQ